MFRCVDTFVKAYREGLGPGKNPVCCAISRAPGRAATASLLCRPPAGIAGSAAFESGIA